MEARQRVEDALAQARGAVDDAAAREARRLVEEGIVEQGRGVGEAEAERAEQRGRWRISGGSECDCQTGGTGEVLEMRADGKVVVAAGAMKMVAETARPSRRQPEQVRRGATSAHLPQSAPLPVPGNRSPGHDRR